MKWDDKGTGLDLPAFLDIMYTNRELVLDMLAVDKQERKALTVGKHEGKPCLYYIPNKSEALCSHHIPFSLSCWECKREGN